MQKKKTEHGFATRAKYEAPEACCFQCEMEGVIAGSLVDFEGGASHGITDQAVESFGIVMRRNAHNSISGMEQDEF